MRWRPGSARLTKLRGARRVEPANLPPKTSLGSAPPSLTELPPFATIRSALNLERTPLRRPQTLRQSRSRPVRTCARWCARPRHPPHRRSPGARGRSGLGVRRGWERGHAIAGARLAMAARHRDWIGLARGVHACQPAGRAAVLQPCLFERDRPARSDAVARRSRPDERAPVCRHTSLLPYPARSQDHGVRLTRKGGLETPV